MWYKFSNKAIKAINYKLRDINIIYGLGMFVLIIVIYVSGMLYIHCAFIIWCRNKTIVQNTWNLIYMYNYSFFRQFHDTSLYRLLTKCISIYRSCIWEKNLVLKLQPTSASLFETLRICNHEIQSLQCIIQSSSKYNPLNSGRPQNHLCDQFLGHFLFVIEIAWSILFYITNNTMTNL